MTRVFPVGIRARYFARRSRFAQLAVLGALVVAGLTLHQSERAGLQLTAFAALFAVAGACRVVSARYLALESEPLLKPEDHPRVHFGEVWRRLRREQGGRLLIYLVSVQAAIWVAGPFFSPYMLKELDFDYETFMRVTSCAFLAKVLMLPVFGMLAHRFDTAWLMWFGGVGIIPLPALWIVSSSVPYLIMAQLAAGTVWAAHELAALLLMFETISSKDRTSILTVFNVGNALGLVLGSTAGGLLLHLFGQGHPAYMVVFGVSSVLRILTLGFLAGVRLRIAHPIPIAVRTLSANPSEGSINRPILPSVGEPPSNALEAEEHTRPQAASDLLTKPDGTI